MRKLLIVDDEERQIEALYEAFRRDFDVICAGPDKPVEDALDEWRHHTDLRLALVDLSMPFPDDRGVARRRSSEAVGFELIKDLKRLRSKARIAVHSAYQTHENLAQSIRIGADAFIGKDWKREEKLANVHFLWSWVTAASAIGTLSRSMKFRDPLTAGHSERVRDYCRAIVLHFNDATPGEFDLASCSAAAELHDLGMIEIPSEKIYGNDTHMTIEHWRVLERHIDAAEFLEELGPGFKKVAEIVREHHRWYEKPKDAGAVDYPKGDTLPRGDNIRIETRVLAVANAVDVLAADRPFRRGLDVESLRSVIGHLSSLGQFDPKVVAALEQLIRSDRERFDEIYDRGKIRDEERLRLHFAGMSFTMRRLRVLMAELENVMLMTGRAVDRLTVERIEQNDAENGGSDAITVTLRGWVNDIDEARSIFKRRIEEADSCRGKSEMPEVVQRALRTIPTRIE